MDDRVRRALTHGQVIDITTTGRRSGEAPLIEDPDERRRIFEWITTHAWGHQDVERMLAYSTLIEVTPDLDAA